MKNLHTRIALPVALLLGANLLCFGWMTWHQLSEDVATGLQGYAAGLDRMIVASLKESMRRNDREHLARTIEEYGRLEWVQGVRVIDKRGRITFSSNPRETGQLVSTASETCRMCHRSDPTPATRMVVHELEGERGAFLQAAEAITAEEACVECHHTSAGTALGVLVVDLDMGPLSANLERRAFRNLGLLLFGSLALLGLLVLVVRRVVASRLVGIGEALASIRMGRRVSANPGSPADEIDDLKQALAALGTDFEDRQLEVEISRWMDVELTGRGFPVILADAAGRVLLVNDEAQRRIGRSYADLAGRPYAEIDEKRREVWARSKEVPVVVEPRDRAKRAPGGADLVLFTLTGADGKPIAFLEAGPGVAEREGEAPTEPPPQPAAFPRDFMRGPYRTVGPEGDAFLRAVLLLANLDRDALETGSVVDLDPTVANGMKTFRRLLALREIVDRQVGVCDVARTVEDLVSDFRRAEPDEVRWHVAIPEPPSLVAHPVLLRQLLTVFLEMARDLGGKHRVLFVQPRQNVPRFFLGVWTDTTKEVREDPLRWGSCQEIADRFNGRIERNPSFDLSSLADAYPADVPPLGPGLLFLVDLPGTIAQPVPAEPEPPTPIRPHR